ncbi:unnamed protein product [Cyprideis torosa]|uniref:Uncharacterized protein n=1 Tax=Cyprideis torosa TaxID=163714 RepID=A0A7R8ZG82_9CRUS|nr:unnamed protein product [Cyprideis torosa]CAG0881041.1 unnamed protein product [Cyprideis torosa]
MTIKMQQMVHGAPGAITAAGFPPGYSPGSAEATVEKISLTNGGSIPSSKESTPVPTAATAGGLPQGFTDGLLKDESSLLFTMHAPFSSVLSIESQPIYETIFLGSLSFERVDASLGAPYARLRLKPSLAKTMTIQTDGNELGSRFMEEEI